MVTTKGKKGATSSSAPGQNVFRAIPVGSVIAKKKQVSKKVVPKNERRNHKGWMDGLRAELVSPLIPAYMDALEISRQAGALKMKEIQHLFHWHFPWPIQDWEEPPRPFNRYDPLAPLPAPPDLTEERAVLWAAHMNDINKRLERWIKRRIGTLTTAPRLATSRFDPNDPVALMLGKLCGSKRRIRARSGAQQFLHDEYAVSGVEAAVEAEFALRPDQSVKKIPLALKQRITKEFFDKLPKDKQEMWVAKAKAKAEIERKDSVDGASQDDPAVIATCVRNTPSFLSKLSKGLDTVAGLKVFTMVAGPMGMYDGQVGYFDVTTTKNNGSTGMTFMEWLGPERSGDLVEAYMMYVETCVSENDKARVVQPDATVPDWSTSHTSISNVPSRTASFRELAGIANGQDDSDVGEEDDEEDMDDDDDDPTTKFDAIAASDSTHVAPMPSLHAAPTPSLEVVPMTSAQEGLQRPKPRPVWAKDVEHRYKSSDEQETYPAELKRAALEALRRKRAHRRVEDGSDEEMAADEEEESRERKRQRTAMLDVTNLPEVPGMDGGRFVTLASKDTTHEPMADHEDMPATPSPPHTPICPSPHVTPTTPRRDPTLSRHQTPSDPARELVSTISTREGILERLTSDEAGCVEWLVDPLKEFVAADGADDLLRVMEQLWTLERQYVSAGIQPKKRATLTRGKNADGSERLKILGDWVAGGRTRKRRLVIERAMLPKFVKEWNGWWSSLQPAWRKKYRGSYARDTVDGDFEMLSISGANGMLSVVATLSWWRSAISGKGVDQWLTAVEDVEWVMERLIEATQST